MLFICQSLLLAQSHIWTGNGNDTNWFNSSNWAIGTIPTSDSDVLISNGFLVEIINEPAITNSITLTGIASLNIENNLTFSGQIDIPIGSNINWLKGIISGGGNIVNNGLIQLESMEDKELINTTLNNYGAIYITNSNVIRLAEGTIINNDVDANIDILSNGGIIQDDLGNTLNNHGTISKLDDGNGGSFYMIYDMNNFGSLDIAEGHQYLFLVTSSNLYNAETGVMQGKGAYDITATFVNDGTYSPAGPGTIGTMDVVNNFTFSTDSTLEIDIAGPNPGDYDVMEVFGFPNLEGSIQLNLSYAPEIGDEYGILTANNITSCNLSDYVYATFEGLTYEFIVFCNPTNVTLRTVNITLDSPSPLNINSAFYVYPNPVNQQTALVYPSEILERYSEISLIIFNALGQEVKTISITTETIHFDGSALKAGIYFIILKSGAIVVASAKFVKE